ncbi:MAG: hypothetical protein NVSMB27_31320 [Ktedonobacteraceae bacterium]
MAPQVSNPTEQQDELQPPGSQSSSGQRTRFSNPGIVVLLVLLALLILSSTSLLLPELVQLVTHPASQAAKSTSVASSAHASTAVSSATADQDASATATPPIFMPNNSTALPLQLPAGHEVIYEQGNAIYLVSSSSGSQPQVLSTPGYLYNQAVRPILTPSGQLLYSGNGIYLADLSGGTPVQLATLAPNQVITSMVLSGDGTTVAWSTEPLSGNGVIDVYTATAGGAGALTAPTKVFEQASTVCPCFRVFSFINGNTTLLLTDGQQSHEAIQFGLWMLDINNPLVTLPSPQPLLDGNTPQGPLALVPYGNMLLYSTYEGQVPVPTDATVPDDVAVLKYANSLKMTTLDGRPLSMNISQEVLPEQHELNNSTAYHWVTTPIFSGDGHTLIYVEFSTLPQAPYDRSSAIFTAQISGSGKQLRVSKPQLMATSDVMLLELGAWFNNHILTFYGDDTLYALDIQSGAVATIVQTGVYARIIAVVGAGGV